MTRFAQYAGFISAAGLLLVAPASAQTSAKSSQSSTKSKQGSTKSGQGSTKSVSTKAVEAKALQTRVWVNRDTKVYHCPGSIYYGKTRTGEFMEEAQARGYGNRAAQAQGCDNVVTNGPAPLPAATFAAMRMVWLNTESGVYHCPNTSEWGATRRGRYVTEYDASASGHKPAAGKKCGAR